MGRVLYLTKAAAGLVGSLPVEELARAWEQIQRERDLREFPTPSATIAKGLPDPAPALRPLETEQQRGVSSSIHEDAGSYIHLLPLPGLYNLVHIDNLASIVRGGLRCKNDLPPKSYEDISEEGVQVLRDRITIVLECPVGSPRRTGTVHDFVPLFFNHYGPMFIARQERAGDIAVIEVDPAILNRPFALFSDGNVSMQQLRNSPGWEVHVYVSCTGRPSVRRHFLGGRETSGSQQSASNIYHGAENLSLLPWEVITSRSGWRNFPEGRRRRAAEVLIPRTVPREDVQRIIVRDTEMEIRVRRAIESAGVPIPVEMDRRIAWPA